VDNFIFLYMENQKNTTEIFDSIIVGTGPAGFSAAIYAARRNIKTLLIGKELGGQVIWASEIENYPGLKSINNFELISKMKDQVESLGVEIISQEVLKIGKKEDDIFTIFIQGKQFFTKTVIIAMGLTPRRLAIPGEKELTGKGVSYCATCDGPLFKKKIVAVVGGGNSALSAAEILSNIAEKVYLIYRGDKFRAFENLVSKVYDRENIEIIMNSQVLQINGDNKVENIIVKNDKKNIESEIIVNGIFIEIGRIASSEILSELIDLDEKNQVITDEKGRTSTEGIFAAGDIINRQFKQIVIACGQGSIAALAAYEYLQLKSS
jgi:thioredoxin-disulfide reductase